MLTEYTEERIESSAKSTNVGVGVIALSPHKNAFRREYKPTVGMGEKTWKQQTSQENSLKN